MIDMATRWDNAMRRSQTISAKEMPSRHQKRRVFVVKSASQDNLFYQVIVMRGKLTCSCPAGSHGLPCKHKARVARELGMVVQ